MNEAPRIKCSALTPVMYGPNRGNHLPCRNYATPESGRKYCAMHDPEAKKRRAQEKLFPAYWAKKAQSLREQLAENATRGLGSSRVREEYWKALETCAQLVLEQEGSS